MNKRLKLTKKFIYISALVFIVLFSVGYSALSQVLNISGSTRYNKKYPVRVTGIQLQGVTNSGTEQFNPNYTWNTTTTGVNLPNLNSTVTYAVTVRNYGSEDQGINLNITNNSNSNMTYETSNMPTNNIIPANSTKTFNITIKYNTSTLPGTTTDTMVITYTFGNIGAMFQTGKEVNAKMKRFVNSSATYSSSDSTITNIARYTGTPDSNYLIEANKVSTDEYITPIYMWYDSTNTSIYWYTEASNVYYNLDSSYFYYNLYKIDQISNMSDISSEYTTDMSYMFYQTGYNSTVFTLDLGDKFDTSNVTNMSNMFYHTGQSSTVFTLDLGSKFDTSNVTNMSSMFYCTGSSSTVFTLDLGAKFDTSNVTNMSYMFQSTGYRNTSFTLDLGDNFDTSNVVNMTNMFTSTGYKSTVFTLDLGDTFDTSKVTNMYRMFCQAGHQSTIFTLDLGNLFDTSNVTSMREMFFETGYSSPVFTLDLGSKFDTTNVTNMLGMFASTGYTSTVFTLDLGSKFDTSKVTDMYAMFYQIGYSSPVFTLDLGDNFDTSKVTKMNGKDTLVATLDYRGMFYRAGYSSPVFTLDLGDKFDTSNVTDMQYMFMYTGYSSTAFTLDLGDKFDTINVTNMFQMFSNTGRSSTVFTLDLGDKFDTSNVTNMQYMFYYTGYSSTVFTLDLGTKFDTSNVTIMSCMFNYTGYNSTVFTLDLGSSFDTSKVTNMSYMFQYVGYSNSYFTELDLGSFFDTSKVTNMSYMFSYCRYLTTIYAPSTFVTTAVTSSNGMFTGCTNLVGGTGTVYSSSNVTHTYAHIDGGTSNPGYFTARGSKIATIYYNSNTTSGSITVSKAITSCVPASGSSSCTITVPSVVSSSVGKYNSTYKGVSTSLSSMANSSLTISSNTTFYANYSKQVTNYYYGSSYTSRTLYRNEFFTSTSAMASRLSTSNTSTTNYSTAVGPGSSVWTGLSTGADTTTEYSSVQNAANSNSATLYTVYTFNVTYAKGSNVSAIGATSGSCKVTTSSTSCNVTLPSITANSGYNVVGWSTTSGATTGTSAGSSYSLSSNGTKLYANATAPPYVMLQYITSVAGSKFKDTSNAVFSGWSGAKFDFDIMSTSTSTQYLLYRNRNSYYDFVRISGTTVSFEYDDAASSISGGITTNTRQTVTFQISGSGSDYTYKLTANGKSASSSDGPLSFQYRILFGNTSTNSFIGRIYGLKYYLNTTTLKNNFLPAKRTSDGAIGLYDSITDTFIKSNGTAEFTAGPVAS